MRSVYAISALVGALLLCRPAYADGKRDLDDGIAFYENLDSDRALQRLTAASKASDLTAKERARAFLYLGMVQFENGARGDAEKAWKSAFELDRNVEVPKGTSPKAIEAIEAARATSRAPGVETTPPVKQEPLPKVETPPPPIEKQTPAEKQPDLTASTTPDPVEKDEGSSAWIWIAAIGAVVVAGGVVGLVVATSGSDCEGGGGCVAVSFR